MTKETSVRDSLALSIVEPLFVSEAWRRQWLVLARDVDVAAAAKALQAVEPAMQDDAQDLLRLAAAFNHLAARSDQAAHLDHAEELALLAGGDPSEVLPQGLWAGWPSPGPRRR